MVQNRNEMLSHSSQTKTFPVLLRTALFSQYCFTGHVKTSDSSSKINLELLMGCLIPRLLVES